jgi:hypothetical protein
MAISLMRRVDRPAGSSAKGISEPKGTSGCFAGARGQRTDIDTVEMECVWAQQFETAGHGNHDHWSNIRSGQPPCVPGRDRSSPRTNAYANDGPENSTARGTAAMSHTSRLAPDREGSGLVNRIPESAFALQVARF